MLGIIGLLLRLATIFNGFWVILIISGALTGVILLTNLAAYQSNTLTFSLSYCYGYQLNLMGLALWYAGVIVGVLVLFLADTRIFFFKAILLSGMFFFFLIIWFFVNELDLINLFLLYELFLLPSFFLVYYVSPNRRSIIAAIYFLTWTQFGSLLVLAALMWLYIQGGALDLGRTSISHFFVFFLLFLGFGIKIPMWPFYYWLTKTHVEASSFFSIYLSGFLVKTAVFLFAKFFASIGLTYLCNLFIVLFLLGIIDSSIKMWHQIDLKKLIAYTTVQEMNFLMIPILWNDYFGEVLVSLFIVTHCILSSLFFFIIDIIMKRYQTRAATQITGLVHVLPTFSFFIFLSWVGFTGLPFTIKFFLEISIFNYLLNYNILFFGVTIFIMNVVGLIGFSRAIFNILFGAPIIFDRVVLDLTKRELVLFIFLLTNLIGFNQLTLFI